MCYICFCSHKKVEKLKKIKLYKAIYKRELENRRVFLYFGQDLNMNFVTIKKIASRVKQFLFKSKSFF